MSSQVNQNGNSSFSRRREFRETYDDRRLNIINLHSCLLSTVSIFIYFRSAEKSMFFPRKWRKDRMLSPQFRLFPFFQSFFGSHYSALYTYNQCCQLCFCHEIAIMHFYSALNEKIFSASTLKDCFAKINKFRVGNTEYNSIVYGSKL